jgi:hypothetical protein
VEAVHPSRSLAQNPIFQVWFASVRAASWEMQTTLATWANSMRYATGRIRSTHELLIDGFVESVIANQPPPVSAEEGREAVRVMNMIVEELGRSPANKWLRPRPDVHTPDPGSPAIWFRCLRSNAEWLSYSTTSPDGSVSVPH